MSCDEKQSAIPLVAVDQPSASSGDGAVSKHNEKRCREEDRCNDVLDKEDSDARVIDKETNPTDQDSAKLLAETKTCFQSGLGNGDEEQSEPRPPEDLKWENIPIPWRKDRDIAASVAKPVDYFGGRMPRSQERPSVCARCRRGK